MSRGQWLTLFLVSIQLSYVNLLTIYIFLSCLWRSSILFQSKVERKRYIPGIQRTKKNYSKYPQKLAVLRLGLILSKFKLSILLFIISRYNFGFNILNLHGKTMIYLFFMENIVKQLVIAFIIFPQSFA